jgi:lysophospholipase L1-like esterase
MMGSKFPRAWIVVAAAYLLLLHGIAVWAVAGSDRAMRMWGSLFPPPELGPGEATAAATLARLAPFLPRAAVFVGDSHVVSLNVAALADRAVNVSFGGTGTTVTAAAALPRQARLLDEAAVVVLHVGFNDLYRRTPSETIERYRALLALVPAATPVVVSAVLPVNERFRQAVAAEKNRQTAALNDGLRALCNARPGCVFADGARPMMDDRGMLDRHYDIGDGVHLSPAGYAALAEALRSAVKAVSRP